MFDVLPYEERDFEYSRTSCKEKILEELYPESDLSRR